MKVTVSKQAVKEFIREMMNNPGVGWESHGDLSTAPVGVSAVVDPSAAATDPGNPKFKPRNRMELAPAVSSLIGDISDDDATHFYDALQGALKDMKEEDEDMKDNKKVEEAIRLSVRKMLRETGPYRDTGMSYSGPMTGSAVRAGFDECETCEGEGYLPDGNECKVCKGTGEVKAKAKRGYQMADVEGGMGTFDEIAKEMGYAGPPGARQAVEKAMKKAQFVGAMDPDDLQILTLTAMNDYVDMLKKSGELTAADVQLMKDHPNIVSELDGFREFLDKYIKNAMKG